MLVVKKMEVGGGMRRRSWMEEVGVAMLKREVKRGVVDGSVGR